MVPPIRIAVAGFVSAGLLAVSSVAAHAQEHTARDHVSIIANARASTLPDGRIVVSMDVMGDLRGLLTMTLAADGDAVTGTWAMVVSYLQELRPDGTEIARTDHVNHDHDEGPNTPDVHREYAVPKFDGVLTGTIESASLLRAPDGRVVAVDTSTLVVDSGSRSFAGAAGFGSIAPSPNDSGVVRLLLNF
jgi:hypothetical protein